MITLTEGKFQQICKNEFDFWKTDSVVTCQKQKQPMFLSESTTGERAKYTILDNYGAKFVTTPDEYVNNPTRKNICKMSQKNLVPKTYYIFSVVPLKIYIYQTC